jgi:hypothetical protein
MTSQDAVALLVPVITAVIGTLGISLQDRQLRRSATEQHKAAFEDAIRRVSFATQWLQAKQSLGGGSAQLDRDDEQVARAWINQASAIAQSTGVAVAADDTRSLTRRLFLLYEMKGWAAKVVRVVFYLPVGFVGWIALIALGEVLSNTTYEDQLSWEVTGSVMGGLAALVLRVWAVGLDTRKRARLATAAATTP